MMSTFIPQFCLVSSPSTRMSLEPTIALLEITHYGMASHHSLHSGVQILVRNQLAGMKKQSTVWLITNAITNQEALGTVKCSKSQQ